MVIERSRSLIQPAKLGSGHVINCQLSRSSQPFRDAVEELNLRSTILDGEIVALDDEGIPRFQLLQKWQKRPTAPVVFVLFDLLWDSGRDLTGNRIVQRRERLEHPARKAIARLVKDQSSPTARVRCLRLH
jgi:ATP-dependent DNA ligase